MQIMEIMYNVTKLSSNSSISKAAEIMDQKSIGSVLIEEDSKIIGIMTERDIWRKIVAKGENPSELKVKDIMNSPIITIDANEHILEASKKMEQHKIRRIVVTENEEIVGHLTANSISKNLKFLMARDTDKHTRVEY